MIPGSIPWNLSNLKIKFWFNLSQGYLKISEANLTGDSPEGGEEIEKLRKKYLAVFDLFILTNCKERLFLFTKVWFSLPSPQENGEILAKRNQNILETREMSSDFI